MKFKTTATAADGTKFERMAARVYAFAVIYHRAESAGYYTPTMHSRLDLAQKAAADVGSNVARTEIVPVEVARPTIKRVRNELAKLEKTRAWWKAEDDKAPGKFDHCVASYDQQIADLRADFPEAF